MYISQQQSISNNFCAWCEKKNNNMCVCVCVCAATPNHKLYLQVKYKNRIAVRISTFKKISKNYISIAMYSASIY